MDVRAIQRKMQRLRSGDAPRVLDLFSGCGGLSLGFLAAGYSISAAVENDPDAARSHAANFHSGNAAHSVPRDITNLSPEGLAAKLGLGDVAYAFDVIVGGPPCQAFARVGRSKLREVEEHPEAFRHDPRARLYIEYLHYVEACAPLAVVIENVPDMLNHGGHNLADEIAELLTNKGYVCRYSLLNAAFYGVPQMRERMILIALRKEIASSIDFPSPTHWVDLPQGYSGSRAVALSGGSAQQKAAAFYQAAPGATNDLTPAITAEAAIGDLPRIDARSLLASGLLRRGTRRFNVPQAYTGDPPDGTFAREMRAWPAFEGKSAVYDHVIRYLPRDYRIFAGLKPGDQYPQAHQYALRLFNDELDRLAGQGLLVEEDGEAWIRLKADMVPPYDPGKFPNKWRKMEADRPARTLLAHLGKDSYSHIHYDSSQARPISVREAARLQSFPDGFTFAGTMNPAFRQIGNAVPPLLANAIASCLRRQLCGAVDGVTQPRPLAVAFA